MTKNELKTFPENSGIYLITNLINNKVYIGQAINIKKRLLQHYYIIRKKLYLERHLYAAINKYGVCNFSVTVLETSACPDRKELSLILNQLEVKYILEYKSNNPKYGYNETSGAEKQKGCVHSESAKLKISKALKEYYTNHSASENTIQANNIYTYGYNFKEKYFIEAESRTKLVLILQKKGYKITHSYIDCVISGKWKQASNFVFGNSKEECLNRVNEIRNSNNILIKDTYLLINIETSEQQIVNAEEVANKFKITKRTAQNLVSKYSKSNQIYKKKYKIKRITNE